MKLLIALLALSAQANDGRHDLVDIHAHLFMEHGMGLMFQGDFHSPLKAGDWTSRFSSQINEKTLEESGLGLVVIALYSHPIFNVDRREAIRRQIREAEALVKRRPDWVIAKNAAEAQAARAAGKRILVLSLEGASGILETETDFKEFIDQKGISVVTFAHLTDDHLTGAALMPGYKGVASPFAFIEQFTDPHWSKDRVRINSFGMTEKGKKVARALIRRKVWIDLAHAPEATEKDLVPMLKAVGQPLLYTHIGMRKYHRCERSISLDQLKAVKETGGIVGLIPSDEIVGATPVPAKLCPAECKGACEGGLWAFAAQYQEMASVIGDDAVFVGSDFNGAMQHLKPTRCLTSTPLDEKPGYFHIGQTPLVWTSLVKATARATRVSQRGVDRFIEVWSKVHAPTYAR